MWDPSEILSSEKVEPLKREFIDWLKKEKGMVNQPNVKHERNRRWKELESIIKEIHNPTLKRVLEEVEIRLISGNSNPVLEDIKEFLSEQS